MNLSSFIHKKSYEEIKYIVRRHFITFLPMALFFILLLIGVPGALYILLKSIAPGILLSPTTFPILVILTSIYCLSILLFFYAYFIDFYLDVTIITNDRLVDVKQTSLFARTISEVDLYQIQDAASEVNGIFATAFNFGNITIQTAGPHAKFDMRNVPHPHSLRQHILHLASEDKKFHNA